MVLGWAERAQQAASLLGVQMGACGQASRFP